jgi:hypothetical protein
MIPVYEEVVRKPNVMKNRNPLKSTASKVLALAQRVKELQNYKQWQKLMAEYRAQGIMLSPKLRPLIQMVKLESIFIDEDIQRALDARHCTKIAAIGSFNPMYLQVIYCVKIPGKDEYHSVDAQHTATLVAAMIDAGIFDGETDWRKVEMPVLYIETTSKAFARKAFALINGKGKKKISPWYEHRTKVMSVRIDNSTDVDDVEAEFKQSICEKYDCYPVDKESAFVGLPGTFTHMEALNLNPAVLTMACKFHNDYFHYDEINGGLWFVIDDLYKAFGAAKIKITDKFLKELAGILQGYFAGIAQFHAAIIRAHKAWGVYTYGYEVSWQDEAIAAALVLLYQKLGGTQQIPRPLLDRFEKILDFIDDDIKALFDQEQEELAVA